MKAAGGKSEMKTKSPIGLYLSLMFNVFPYFPNELSTVNIYENAATEIDNFKPVRKRNFKKNSNRL